MAGSKKFAISYIRELQEAMERCRRALRGISRPIEAVTCTRALQIKAVQPRETLFARVRLGSGTPQYSSASVCNGAAKLASQQASWKRI